MACALQAPAKMHSTDKPSKDSTPKLWSNIDQAAILRLQQLDHEIKATHGALRQQLDELCAFLTKDLDVVAERGVKRLLLILEHSAHLTRQSLALIDERHQLLRF
jgi:hypothetical protein